jgi:hypothetical protein
MTGNDDETEKGRQMKANESKRRNITGSKDQEGKLN